MIPIGDGVMMFTCMCGVSLIGTDEAYSQHLTFYCPVYAEALSILLHKNTAV